MPGKSPSPVRVAVIAGAFAVLASAVTPAQAATRAATQPVAKQRVPKSALRRRRLRRLPTAAT